MCIRDSCWATAISYLFKRGGFQRCNSDFRIPFETKPPFILFVREFIYSQINICLKNLHDSPYFYIYTAALIIYGNIGTSAPAATRILDRIVASVLAIYAPTTGL